MSMIRSIPRRASIVSSVIVVAMVGLLSVGHAGGADAASAGPSGSDGDLVLGSANWSDTTTSLSSTGNAFSADSRQGYGITGASFISDGVFGTSSFASGVVGTSSYVNGVVGKTGATNASGVYGQNDSTGYGVAGRANDGVGVLADSANGTALQANGKVSLSRSGVATVLANHNSVQVTQGGLTAGTTIVVATLQAHVANLYILGVVVDSSTTFTIWLSKAPASSVKVGWFVLN
jgi:hypothetical protein